MVTKLSHLSYSHHSYPLLVGLMLGVMQTGLFFQLGASLSSGFGTYLMITLCWLIGSAIGAVAVSPTKRSLPTIQIVSFISYTLCILTLSLLPFRTELWPLYAVFIVIMGLYPGLFFSRAAPYYRPQTLFLMENNGFILGIIGGTLLILIVNRLALWIVPAIIGLLLLTSHPSAAKPTSVEKPPAMPSFVEP